MRRTKRKEREQEERMGYNKHRPAVGDRRRRPQEREGEEEDKVGRWRRMLGEAAATGGC